MRYIKVRRIGDLVLSLIGLVVLSPVLILIAAAIKLDSPGPVLFRQERVGKEKVHFTILKFRTMNIGAPKDTPTHLLAEPEQHITRIGRLLRRTSLDELPQIWNVVMGDMSIVGPRPALWNQDDLISERDKYRANDIPPGLTGWAQVNGRDELSIEEKARLDGEYMSNLCLATDIKCVLLTVWRVLTGAGVLEGGSRSLR